MFGVHVVAATDDQLPLAIVGHVFGEDGDVSNLRATLDATTWIASIMPPTSATSCATQATQPGDGSRRRGALIAANRIGWN